MLVKTEGKEGEKRGRAFACLTGGHCGGSVYIYISHLQERGDMGEVVLDGMKNVKSVERCW